MTIYEVLADIQGKLAAPKGKQNTFGGYAYRNCEDILHALKPLLSEHNASVILTNAMEAVGDRVYVVATATLHAGSDSISATAHAREAAQKKGMDEAQITGAASSYARKYALAGLFAIDNERDADSQDNRQQQTNAPTKQQDDIKTRFERAKAIICKAMDASKFDEYVKALKQKHNNDYTAVVAVLEKDARETEK